MLIDLAFEGGITTLALDCLKILSEEPDMEKLMDNCHRKRNDTCHVLI
jgi:hypothetical protein